MNEAVLYRGKIISAERHHCLLVKMREYRAKWRANNVQKNKEIQRAYGIRWAKEHPEEKKARERASYWRRKARDPNFHPKPVGGVRVYTPEESKRRRAARRAIWEAENKDRLRAARKLAWQKKERTPEQRKAAVVRAMRWAKEHPERAAMHRRAILARRRERDPEGLKAKYARNEARRGKEKRAAKWATWSAKNKERLKQYQKEHKAQAASRQRARAAIHKKASPVWSDKKKIHSFYEEASRLTKVTGIEHQVDHVIPLRGRTVCGLHVENNLQILSRVENVKKGNRLEYVGEKNAASGL